MSAVGKPEGFPKPISAPSAPGDGFSSFPRGNLRQQVFFKWQIGQQSLHPRKIKTRFQ